MGRPELAADDRYATHAARGQHQTELDDLIADWTRTLTADEVEALMREHGVPHGKIFRAPDMLEDEHFKAREAIVRVTHKQFGDLAMQNTFPKLSDTPGEVRWTGPELGEHTDQVLTDVLGLSSGDIAKLRELGVV
jgi:formyl-CoA transferase